MIDSFNAPQTRHAMMVHFPIVLTFVGAALALLAAILRTNITIRALAIGGQIALIASVFMALRSGEAANSAITQVLTPEVYELVAEHEAMAEKAWMFAVGTILLLALSAMLKSAAGTACAWLAVVASLGGIGWIGATAHHGGTLVYTYGVGTPQPVACFDLPGERSDGRDHAAEHAARQSSSSPAQSDEHSPIESVENAVQAQRVAFFLDQVFPIISEHCFNCHNPAQVARRKAGSLDQTSLAAMLKGGRNGPAIVPSDPDSSLLIRRMLGHDADEEIMPPDGKLTDKDIEIIAQWIRDGAVWADPAGR